MKKDEIMSMEERRKLSLESREFFKKSKSSYGDGLQCPICKKWVLVGTTLHFIEHKYPKKRQAYINNLKEDFESKKTRNSLGFNQYSNWGLMLNFKYCNKCKQIKTLDNFRDVQYSFDSKEYWCIECHKKYSQEERERNYIKYKENYNNIKMKVLTHYGGDPPKCACCGESIIEFLSIDHKNNDGYKQRQKLGQAHTYGWLIQNNFPDGFQVLCMNCNFGRSRTRDKICPHKKVQSI